MTISKWHAISIPDEYYNGLEFLGKKKGISASGSTKDYP